MVRSVSSARSAATPVADEVAHRSDVPSAKLHPPTAPLAQVIRKTLCDKVTGAGPVRLTVVRAPPGFGKTTAMLQLRARYQASDAGVAEPPPPADPAGGGESTEVT